MPFAYTPEEANHIALSIECALLWPDPADADPAYWRHLAEVEAERDPYISAECREHADRIECGAMYWGEELP